MAQLNKIDGSRQIKDASITEGKLAFSVIQSGDYVTNETPAGTVDGSNLAFTLANPPVSTSVILFLNGLAEVPGASGAYTLAGSTITFNAGLAPIVGDVLKVSYLKA